MSPTPGARFVQFQPVKGLAKNNLDGTAAPYTILTVPAKSTYRLRYASVSLCIATNAAFVAAVLGASASVTDSNGNTWAECECMVMVASQVVSNGEVKPCDSALLPANTVVSLALSGPALPITGFALRMGGGAIWVPA